MFTIDKYLEAHPVTYTLVATDENGQIIAKETSAISADDVSGFAWTIDEMVQKHVVEQLAAKADMDDAADTDNLIENERGE